MVDSGKVKAQTIPSWQLPENTDPSNVAEHVSSEDSHETTTPSERAALIEKAAQFLEDEDIRNAPLERKQYFLKSKGLSDDEIQQLLQEQHTTDGEIEEGPQEEQQTASRSESAPDPDLLGDPSSTSPTKDIPPVITYPEFLLHSQKPPPLMTAQQLLTTLYLASAAAATAYGTNKYIVEPMSGALSSARHSFFETASTNLSRLNEKLEKAVSRIPETSVDSNDSETEPTDLEPARFFNRSAATQTSPHLSRASSVASSARSGTRGSPIFNHEAALSNIHDKLRDLLPADTGAHSPLRDSLDDLWKYLDGMAYGREVIREDSVAKVKAEIRGVKGVLLSSRNFPGGVSGR